MKNLILLLIFALLLISCGQEKKEVKDPKSATSGDVIIFNAGSLSKVVKDVVVEFNKKYPNIHIKAESAGSRDCARKITELGRPCDVFLSADYQVIEQLLIPNYASWNLNFASNEIVIAYNGKKKQRTEITVENWTKVLSDPSIKFGRSNPDSDPCGYRSVFVMKLAQIKYNLSNEFYDNILFKDMKYIRPKEVDLLALLETNTVDYIFIYKSNAIQHGLKYISLPVDINLSSTDFELFYQQAEIKLSGKVPGEFMVQKGESITYGLTIPKSSPNPKAAATFVKFFLEKENGQRILVQNGQTSKVPSSTNTYDKLPKYLQPFALKPSANKTVVDTLK